MLTKEQRDEILRLAAELIKAPSDTWGSFGRLVKFTKYIDSITAPEGWQVVPVEPTGLMVDAGREAMQRAPDLGGIVSANTAEVMDSYTAMLAAAPKPGGSNG